MKPPIIYTALLALTLAATTWAFSAGQAPYGYTTLFLGTAVLLSHQSVTRMATPFWMEGVDFTPPATGVVLSASLLIEAAAVWQIQAGLAIHLAITTRAIGFLLQMALLGKIRRDQAGDHVGDQAGDPDPSGKPIQNPKPERTTR